MPNACVARSMVGLARAVQVVFWLPAESPAKKIVRPPVPLPQFRIELPTALALA